VLDADAVAYKHSNKFKIHRMSVIVQGSKIFAGTALRRVWHHHTKQYCIISLMLDLTLFK